MKLRLPKHFFGILTLNYLRKTFEAKITSLRVDKEKAIDSMVKKIGFSKPLEAGMYELAENKDPLSVLATNLRHEEQKLIIKLATVKIIQKMICLLVILLLVGTAQLWLPELGQVVNKEYYSSMIQVYPVLLIAFYLSSFKRERPTMSSYMNIVRVQNINTKFTGLVSIIFGMVSCLVVLASGSSTTFSFSITIISSMVLMLIIFENITQDQS